ncbi:MAG: cohesin domain-containing protein [Candidatus Berkelbacteria bacterium]|nr:cohesin domain-containing protein [Candidatus Berkelbacteria bacterium]
MKRFLPIILGVFALVFLVLPGISCAADEAVFSATSSQTSYNVGDEIPVSFSVAAGPYDATLNVIDFDIKISDTSVIEPKDTTSPFVAGTIFTSIALQSYTNGIINAVFHPNPSSMPASRSGVIGTVTFKALKTGTATISFDRIEAAEAKSETQFITTSASSLVVNIGEVTTTTNESTVEATETPTPTPVNVSKAASSAATGPEDILLIVGVGGIVAYLAYRIIKSIKHSAQKI